MSAQRECSRCAARNRMWMSGPSDLMKRRYPPNGDVQEWVRHGPAGPPAEGTHNVSTPTPGAAR